MARITVEDCLPHVPNHFELIVLAARRARDLSAGASPRVDRDQDKNTLVALREIAQGAVTREELLDGVVANIAVPPRPSDEAYDLVDLEPVTIGENDEDDEG